MRRTPLWPLSLPSPLSLTAAACEPSLTASRSTTVGRATVIEVVDVPASVTARAVATLTAPADGTLASLTVEPGATVAKDAVRRRDRLAGRPASAWPTPRPALAAASRRRLRIRAVDLSGVQDGLDAAAADAFAAARTAAGEVADERIRAALLAQVDAAQPQYETTPRTSRALHRQVQQGLAGIGEAVAALGAAQRAQAQGRRTTWPQSTVDALTLRAPIAGVVQFARPAAAAPADPLASLLGAGRRRRGPAARGRQRTPDVAGVDDVLSVGDRVSAGTAVVTIVDVSEIGLVGEVDETDVLLVAPGITADVELDAAPGLALRGHRRHGRPAAHAVGPGRGGLPDPARRSGAAEPATGAGRSPPTPRPA